MNKNNIYANFLGTIGLDEYTKIIKNEFIKRNLNTKYLFVVENKKTLINETIIDKKGQKSLSVIKTDNKPVDFSVKNIYFDILILPSFITYFDEALHDKYLKFIEKAVEEEKISLFSPSIQKEWISENDYNFIEKIQFFIAKSTITFLSVNDAISLTKKENLNEAIRDIREWKYRYLIILAKEEIFIMDKKHDEVRIVEAPKIKKYEYEQFNDVLISFIALYLVENNETLETLSKEKIKNYATKSLIGAALSSSRKWTIENVVSIEQIEKKQKELNNKKEV
ncbi:PfkB family carbohydrate kinase [Mesomycoplasma lagogenitalium]|uniref:PfkB family carbohydrate kinase n=1 Tax=Mesomycoplasma lagogenitalium TaxID=171286 RepID=A0ABY8LUH7_9BACT|nr:PfkB family carbohydrate kinase [Mesomycoplasma lagogenitalium]WGI36890.1 PfkB family carbohydrate kinase [Mesomycoplasma lagogenitalium]